MNGDRPECVYGIQHKRCTLFGRESLEASQLGLTDSQYRLVFSRCALVKKKSRYRQKGRNMKLEEVNLKTKETFLTKSGDLGMVLRVKGIDYESLDHASRDRAVKRLEAALRAFDSRVRVYQALLKANEPAIPHREYTNPLVKAAIDQRMAYFAAKADQLYSIDVYWIVVVQGSYAKSTLWEALQQRTFSARRLSATTCSSARKSQV